MSFPEELDVHDELELEIKPDPNVRVEYYRDSIGEWRWSMLAANGNVIADSGEGYHNRSDMLEILEKLNPGIPVTERDAEAQA